MPLWCWYNNGSGGSRKPASLCLLWWAQSSGYPLRGDLVRGLLYDISFSNMVSCVLCMHLYVCAWCMCSCVCGHICAGMCAHMHRVARG